MRVVKQLVEPFHTMNHVVYMDNFYTSGPLIVYTYVSMTYIRSGYNENVSRWFPLRSKGCGIS